MHEKQYWLGFSVFPGVGPKKFTTLRDHFGTAEAAWQASENDLLSQLGPALTAKFIQFRSAFSPASYESTLNEHDVRYVTMLDDDYPKLLSSCANIPFVLYVKGSYSFNAPQEKHIAIVGTRKITSYGKEVTTRLTEDLVHAGYTIISGLALGVDAVAHSVTMLSGGKTIAVLGCGVDCCYPSANKLIYDKIVATGGAIISEFPLGMSPSPGSFPSRNRIIAGLSHAVVVTEGSADSGALYTADDAFLHGRPVYAVPGPITSSLSAGPHSLLAKGGKLITSAQDILRDLGDATKVKQRMSIKGDTPEEQQVLDMLALEELHVDELSRKLKKDAASLSSLLSLMEMKGMIQSIDGGIFSIAT